LQPFLLPGHLGLNARLLNHDDVSVFDEYYLYRCVYRQCIALAATVLRVIILGLALYHSSVYGKYRIINGLGFFEGWILRKGKGNMAHARLAR